MELQDVLTIIDHVARTDALREVEIDDHGYRICVKTDRNRGEGDAGFSGGSERAAGKAGLADRPEAGLAVRRENSLADQPEAGCAVQKENDSAVRTAAEESGQTAGSLSGAEKTEAAFLAGSCTEKADGSENGQPDRSHGGKEYIVASPLVGTFYAAPEEGKEPYVKEGDRVSKGQVLGIVEAMKLMNEIESEYDGVIEAVLIQNGQVVEYGQPLFRIADGK